MLKTYFLDTLTETQAYRPQHLNTWVNFDVESKLEVEHVQFFVSRPENVGKANPT